MGQSDSGGEHVSRNASEPDSASIGKRRWPVRRRGWSQTDRWWSNRRMQPSDLPGWLGTARVDRSVEEPGRPCRAGAKATNGRREDITGVTAL